jgi:hypothetical protein
MISVMDSLYTTLAALGLFGICIGVVSTVADSFGDVNRSISRATVDSLWFSAPSALIVIATCICGQAFVKTKALPGSVSSFGIAFLAALACYIVAMASGISFFFAFEALKEKFGVRRMSWVLDGFFISNPITAFFLEITKASIIWSFIKSSTKKSADVISKKDILMKCLTTAIATGAMFVMIITVSYLCAFRVARGDKSIQAWLTENHEHAVGSNIWTAVEIFSPLKVIFAAYFVIFHVSSSIITSCGYAKAINNDHLIQKKNAIFTSNLLVVVAFSFASAFLTSLMSKMLGHSSVWICVSLASIALVFLSVVIGSAVTEFGQINSMSKSSSAQDNQDNLC